MKIRQKTKLLSISFAVFASIVVFCISSSAANKLKPVRETREMMGTFVEITIYEADEARANSALEAGFAEIARVESVMSLFKPESELSRLNRSGTAPFKASDELFKLLEESRRYSELSGGVFDVTVGPLMKVWKDARKKKVKPSPAAVAAARDRTGYKKMLLDPATKTVRFAVSGMQVDLGAIAKGYGADRAAAVIKKYGVTSALINAGGDIRAVGGKKNSGPWTVALQNPRSPDEYLLKLAIKDKSVTTSGDYEQYFTAGGRRYSHIIDPRTGTSETGCMSATVIARTAMQADALSTALCALGVRDALKIAGKAGGVEAAVVGMDRRIVRTKGFSKYEIK